MPRESLISFISVVVNRDGIIQNLFPENVLYDKNVILVLNQESFGEGRLIFSSNYVIWCKEDDETIVFIVDISDASATGRSKFQMDTTNCTVVIMDYYYKIIDRELEKCSVEDTLVVGYAFEDDVSSKSTALYTKLMGLMNDASTRQVQDQLDRGEDIDEPASDNDFSDDDSDNDMEWDGTIDEDFQVIDQTQNNNRNGENKHVEDGQFDDD